ncbi:MAG TPA: GNAT family N-acetyltransferase [Roseomonas sp.]|nr:GNAT family N-acetyltransferase [Roseomonas sp.]
MTPRRAGTGEAGALRDLVRAAYARWVPEIGREPAPMTDDYAARIAAGQAWVIEDAGRLVGALVIEDTPTGLLIDNVAAAPEAQGTGLGRALMAFAEAEAQRRGHRRMWLYTHEKMVRNIALYERLGFVETHRAEQAGFARVFMAKAVTPAPRPRPKRQPVNDRPRPPLLHRLALSLIGPERRRPRRGLVLFFGTAGTLFLGLGGVMGHDAWRDWRMAEAWPSAQATVVAVGRVHWVRSARHFALLLRATAPGGRTVERWAIRDHIVPRRLEDPDPQVRVGDRIAVVMDPQDPSRMVTRASLRHVPGLISVMLFGGVGLMQIVAGLAAAKARRIVQPG